jgi:hypothetical protein
MHIWVSAAHRKQWLKHIERKESEWKQERQMLLDRVQAPSFAEYTSKVVREKKAEKKDEEEKQIEFVS